MLLDKCNELKALSGVFLADDDECRSPEICGSNAVCNNQPGSFHCECSAGFLFASDGKTCIGTFKCVCLCASVWVFLV